MIFATVGTDEHDFSRLVRRMDKIAKSMEVVIQVGNTIYRPKNARWFRFESNKAIDDFYRKARVIVTHGGAGSVLRSVSEGKRPIVVPRRSDLGEHINDHQISFCRFLAERDMITLVEDVELLERAIVLRTHKTPRDSRLVRRISNLLNDYEKQIS